MFTLSLEGSTIYCTHTPCVLCAKMLINARIKRSVTFSNYNDDTFKELYREAGVEVEIRERPSSLITFLD